MRCRAIAEQSMRSWQRTSPTAQSYSDSNYKLAQLTTTVHSDHSSIYFLNIYIRYYTHYCRVTLLGRALLRSSGRQQMIVIVYTTAPYHALLLTAETNMVGSTVPMYSRCILFDSDTCKTKQNKWEKKRTRYNGQKYLWDILNRKWLLYDFCLPALVLFVPLLPVFASSSSSSFLLSVIYIQVDTTK